MKTITIDITELTRADLTLFGNLDIDGSGNPCVWRNFYECDHTGSSAEAPFSWDDTHSCQCDDECPVCGNDVSPVESIWVAGVPEALETLWEVLLEA